MTSAHRAMLGWATSCGVLGFVAAVALVRVVAGDVVRCDTALQAVEEPAGWRAWPEPPSLGGYRVEGERGPCVGHGLQCGLTDARLMGPGVCPREALPLTGWFGPHGIYGGERDIHVRSSSGLTVASGFNPVYAGQGAGEVFIGAFRPVPGSPHPAFATTHAMVAAILLSAALLGLLAAGLDAWRRTTRAARYRDGAVFEPARREASGTIVFDDGSRPSIAASRGAPGHAAGPPGPVLVRVAAVTEGTYRKAPAARASEVIEGDVASQARSAAMAGRASLRGAFALGLVLLLLAFTTQLLASVGSVGSSWD